VSFSLSSLLKKVSIMITHLMWATPSASRLAYTARPRAQAKELRAQSPEPRGRGQEPRAQHTTQRDQNTETKAQRTELPSRELIKQHSSRSSSVLTLYGSRALQKGFHTEWTRRFLLSHWGWRAAEVEPEHILHICLAYY